MNEDTTSALYKLAAQSRANDHLDDVIRQDVHLLDVLLKGIEDVVVRETVKELLACVEEKANRRAAEKSRP